LRELGTLLGFTTSAAFPRAFRRWTGTTAASFRRQVLMNSPNC
jgi:AraC-like DNA-binding protein